MKRILPIIGSNEFNLVCFCSNYFALSVSFLFFIQTLSKMRDITKKVTKTLQDSRWYRIQFFSTVPHLRCVFSLPLLNIIRFRMFAYIFSTVPHLRYGFFLHYYSRKFYVKMFTYVCCNMREMFCKTYLASQRTWYNDVFSRIRTLFFSRTVQHSQNKK